MPRKKKGRVELRPGEKRGEWHLAWLDEGDKLITTSDTFTKAEAKKIGKDAAERYGIPLVEVK